MKNTSSLDRLASYQQVRQRTEAICRPLEIEDYVIQGMEDVSPAKWHLAHTTWFFETFILKSFMQNYRPFDPRFYYLFNSYYQQVSEPFPRPKRGLLSRPTVATIYAYRQWVDKALQELITAHTEMDEKINDLLLMGIHHEQQHQELLLMDIKYNFSLHPDYPSYQLSSIAAANPINKLHLIEVAETTAQLGFSGNGFSYDNERPTHACIIPSFCIANRLITNGEYQIFIEEKGYQRPSFWLSDGWDCILKHHWEAPLYWRKIDNEWYEFTLQGLKKLNPDEPVCHVSFFEADAYARWCEMRLPSEAEWEHFVRLTKVPIEEGHFMEKEYFHPSIASSSTTQPQQFLGSTWEWTRSMYAPYPGYQSYEGVLGEYNEKFMCNQLVLRGGSCITPKTHIRSTYRNFFQAEKRWPFTGIRLAKDA